MPAKVYTQKDAKVTPLRKKTLAVIGYGSQGHAHALNLKESGCKVIVGLYKGSKSIKVAKKHGFEVVDVAEATRRADVIMIGVPDMKQAAVYETEIKPNLSKGKTLLFTHGFAIHFGLIRAPRGISVIMVAPKGPGHVVRSQYKEGKGVPSLIAVHKGSSRDSKQVALAWAAGIGAARAGILQTSFKEETETDLFGEQAVLCGGASALVQAGFETLVEAGYAP
ncbi:MAG: ketol-acid reductoisomerase, partial [Opitutales bacterium]